MKMERAAIGWLRILLLRPAEFRNNAPKRNFSDPRFCIINIVKFGIIIMYTRVCIKINYKIINFMIVYL